MPITDFDIAILTLLARTYVLTREQMQRFLFPDHTSGRTTRKRLTKLRNAGFISKHSVQVVLPGGTGAAPVYYPTKAAAELLTSYFDDPSFLTITTRAPRADRVAHWIAVNDVRLVIEQAIAAQSDVSLDGWINEYEVINKDDAPGIQYHLHQQLQESPPLSCSPDAAMLLSLSGHKKVFALEVDRGTSSPRQIAARKSKGYAELARQQGHRRFFPETTLDQFTVLFITTTKYRRDETARQLSKKPGSHLWLFIDSHELTPERFLHDSIVVNCRGEAAPLVPPTPIQSAASDNSPSAEVTS